MSASVARIADAGRETAYGDREFAFTAQDYRRIAALIHADAGIDLRESKAELVYSRLAKRLRALSLELVPRLLRSRRGPRQPGRAAGNAVGPDDQRHALLP